MSLKNFKIIIYRYFKKIILYKIILIIRNNKYNKYKKIRNKIETKKLSKQNKSFKVKRKRNKYSI